MARNRYLYSPFLSIGTKEVSDGLLRQQHQTAPLQSQCRRPLAWPSFSKQTIRSTISNEKFKTANSQAKIETTCVKLTAEPVRILKEFREMESFARLNYSRPRRCAVPEVSFLEPNESPMDDRSFVICINKRRSKDEFPSITTLLRFGIR